MAADLSGSTQGGATIDGAAAASPPGAAAASAAGAVWASREAVVPFGIAAAPGEPTLRWAGRAGSVAEIERELGRIWSVPAGMAARDGTERHVAARTSVLNLVVVAGSRELGERAAATLAMRTGRHPSRTLVLVPTDPDGPSWLKADVRAYCMIPRPDAPETCAEQVYVAAGGDAGRHLGAIVAPLLVHDLPVTLWWPGDPPFGSPVATALVATADRLVVDGAHWSGDGLDRLAALAGLARPGLPVSDFALMRQARWREAVASIFDRAELLPYLRAPRRIAVTYATSGGPGAEAATNLVKPIYHVAWLASRLDLRVARPLARVDRPAATRRAKPVSGAPADTGRGLRATLARGRGAAVEVVVRPVLSAAPAGTTLRVEVLAEWRGSELRAEVTAEADTVHVRAWQDGVETVDRTFHAPRRTDADLLTEAIEAGGRDAVAEATLAMAAQLAGGPERVGPGASAGADAAGASAADTDAAGAP
jgi:glucose-6-phosphate dehydrogenase assembly protein OpcA